MQTKYILTFGKIVVILFALMILCLGCKKDPCAKTICLNGGACLDGTCKCPDGYSGPHCEIRDPCYGVKCLNGGTCINGSCNCPTGYSGANCSIARIPVSFTINKIVVNKYPVATPTGYYWDPGTTTTKYPDIYLDIEVGTSTNGARSTSISYDVNSLPITYAVNYTMVLGFKYAIALYDYDGSGVQDFMGGIYFSPADYKTGFPSTIPLSISNPSISYTLYVTWNF
jgi:hypothetical protein